MDPISILAGLLPLVVEGGKAAISRWIAPDTFKPSTVEQYVALKKADIDLFTAINTAGGSNPSYPWVEAIVRLMRPSVAMTVMLMWAWIHYTAIPEADTATVDNFAAAIGFYLFGDRTLFYAKKIGGK